MNRDSPRAKSMASGAASVAKLEQVRGKLDNTMPQALPHIRGGEECRLKPKS